jgi:anti-sigma factor RsiW
MPVCDQVKLLLGPFDDGELEPHEMEEVALHVVTCRACKAVLEDYRSLGVALRDSVVEPDLGRFTAAVMGRIALIGQPLHIRIRRRLDSFAESISGGLALAAAGALAALATAWIVSPYAYQILNHHSVNHPQIASRPPESLGSVRSAGGVNVADGPQIASRNGATPTDPSMITLLNDSDPATTVIWVPDQR